MTEQTMIQKSLGGSPAGATISRFSALTLAAILAAGGGMCRGQEKPNAAQPATAKAVQPGEKKAPSPAEGKAMGGYSVHSMVEVGGRFAEKDGSRAMWATMVNQTTGARVLGQSLEMRTLNPAKTPFFDTLSTNSYGYGGDPYDASVLKMSKGRWYDFMGQFRRDRYYYDYNLMPNSLLTSATATTTALVGEPDSLHIFNTVRRNTETLLTLMPTWVVNFRAGYNHVTHEGPTLSSLHGGGDVQLSEWFRTGLDTYIGGVDVRVAKRTTVSYDQFYGLFKGDTMFHLAPTPFVLSNGTPVSLGVDVLTGPTVTCGTGANKTENVINGVANPFCSSTVQQSETAPTRTSFPTEQLRFSSHYWERVAMNGRITYSGGDEQPEPVQRNVCGAGAGERLSAGDPLLHVAAIDSHRGRTRRAVCAQQADQRERGLRDGGGDHQEFLHFGCGQLLVFPDSEPEQLQPDAGDGSDGDDVGIDRAEFVVAHEHDDQHDRHPRSEPEEHGQYDSGLGERDTGGEGLGWLAVQRSPDQAGR